MRQVYQILNLNGRNSFHRKIDSDYFLSTCLMQKHFVSFIMTEKIAKDFYNDLLLFGGKMKITENPNSEIAQTVKEGLKQKGGYCPCRVEKTPDTKCMCKEFRDQIKDPEFEGFCHCMLYYKQK